MTRSTRGRATRIPSRIRSRAWTLRSFAVERGPREIGPNRRQQLRVRLPRRRPPPRRPPRPAGDEGAPRPAPARGSASPRARYSARGSGGVSKLVEPCRSPRASFFGTASSLIRLPDASSAPIPKPAFWLVSPPALLHSVREAGRRTNARQPSARTQQSPFLTACRSFWFRPNQPPCGVRHPVPDGDSRCPRFRPGPKY